MQRICRECVSNGVWIDPEVKRKAAGMKMTLMTMATRKGAQATAGSSLLHRYMNHDNNQIGILTKNKIETVSIVFPGIVETLTKEFIHDEAQSTL
jgi:hypothetical protein